MPEIELFTILIVVVVIMFVGVVLAFVFTTRSSKDKTSAGGPQPENRQLPPDRGDDPNQDALVQQEIEPSRQQAGSPDYGLQLVLDDDRIFHLNLPTTLGRSPKNTIEISDVSVSAVHARIYFERRIGAVCIEDLNSLNGIFVDGRPTAKSVLDDGARLTIGGVSLTFRDTGYLPPTR